MVQSRRYLKRVWRVPKDRGATEYLATLIVKALRKHGWPATWRPVSYADEFFYVLHIDQGRDYAPDFQKAVSTAVRLVARTYRVEVTEIAGCVYWDRPYVVNKYGDFREVN